MTVSSQYLKQKHAANNALVSINRSSCLISADQQILLPMITIWLKSVVGAFLILTSGNNVTSR